MITDKQVMAAKKAFNAYPNLTIEELPNAWRKALEAADAAASKEEVRHVKGGTTYDVVGFGTIQSDAPLNDYDNVVIYRCQRKGTLWVRREEEFYDGRFEIIPPKEPTR